MPERKPIDPNPSTPGNMQSRSLRCEEWESLIPESLDGTLPAADLAAFEEHGKKCASCARMLEEARQGVLWLGFLECRPEPPAGLLHKIISQTSGAANSPLRGRPGSPAPQVPIAGVWVPVWHSAPSPASRSRLHFIEPQRLLMTAAMAFFSLTLILNLMGVNLSKIDLSRIDFSGLRPSALRAQLTRQYYSANAQVVKYYENLRFVYEMEARVRDFERFSEPQPEPQAAPESPSHSPSLHSPASRNGGISPRHEIIQPELTAGFGDRTDAAQAQGKRSVA